jgi:uncharacterized small protein (DUF1192 family)
MIESKQITVFVGPYGIHYETEAQAIRAFENDDEDKKHRAFMHRMAIENLKLGLPASIFDPMTKKQAKILSNEIKRLESERA